MTGPGKRIAAVEMAPALIKERRLIILSSIAAKLEVIGPIKFQKLFLF
jgi:hypothetical protein